MDNLVLQVEELETLNAIYQDEWKNSPIGSNSYTIKIAPNIELFVTLVDEYPSAPPDYELLAPILNEIQKKLIAQQLEKIYQEASGGPILYQWIEKLKEIIDEFKIINVEEKVAVSLPLVDIDKGHKNIDLNIIHGPIIEDRKSTFQGHSLHVTAQEQTSLALELLTENKKIAHATHNISAYRIEMENGIILQDCDDDGEFHAGKRLLHLLQILDLKNVMVIVSRWYGGIHLGPDRFKHISNAARQALMAGNFIES